jgi:ribosomal protein S18 acetylase RimI-like enzyme
MNESDPAQYYDHVNAEIHRARMARDDALAQLFLDATERLAQMLMPEVDSGFRKARASDVDTIVSLINAANTGDGGAAGWTNELAIWKGERTHVEEIITMLAVPQSMFLLRLNEGEAAGCAYLRKTGDAAYLGMLAVRPTLQGLGVGKQIIAEAERIAREEMRCTVMTMGVITNHRPELTAFYERRGYARTGRIKPFEGTQARRESKASEVRAEWMVKALSANQPR